MSSCPIPSLPSLAYHSLSDFMLETGPKQVASIQKQYAWRRAARNIVMIAGMVSECPNGSIPIFSGIVTSISGVTFTDSSADFSHPQKCGEDFGISSLQLQIFFKDAPDYICKCGISASPTIHTLTLADSPAGSPKDWIARGIISSLSDLAGCQYRIFKAGDYSTYDRWPDPPNTFEYISNPTILAASKIPGSYGLCPTYLLTISASAGTFKLKINGTDTGTIPYNAGLADIQSVLPADSTVSLYSTGFALTFGASYVSNPTVVISSSTLTGSTGLSNLTNLLLDGIQTWPASHWITSNPDAPDRPIAYDLVIWDNGAHGDNLVHRTSITGNDSTTLTTSLGFRPSLNFYYSIVAHKNAYTDSIWNPTAKSFQRNLWYSGMYGTEFDSSHMPDETIGSYQQATIVFPLDTGLSVPGPCASPKPYIVAWNGDVRNSACAGDGAGHSITCDEADKIYTPDYWKSDRGLEEQIISLGALFINPDYVNGKTDPNPMIPALLLDLAGVNNFTSTITSISSDSRKAYFTITIPFPRARANWAITDPDGNNVQSGYLEIPSDDTGTYLPGTWSNANVGWKVIISWGLNNSFHYEFGLLRDEYHWIPSVISHDSGPDTLVDPPIATGGQDQKPQIASEVFNQTQSDYVQAVISVTGTLLVAFVSVSGSTNPGAAISDSQSNTWTQVNFVSHTDISVACYIAVQPAASTTVVTFKPTTFGDRLTLQLVDIPGADTTTPIDASSTGSGSSTAGSAGSLTTTAANDLLLSFTAVGSGNVNWTPGSGWTASASVRDSSITAFMLQQKPFAGIGILNTDFGISTSQSYASTAIAVKRGIVTAYIGRWSKRSKGTKYLRHDLGYGQASEDGPAFATNDLAVYRADQSNNPTLPFKSDNILLPYFDKGWVGTCGAAPPNLRYAGKYLDTATGLDYPANIASDGTGTALASGKIKSFALSSGNLIQITADSNIINWFEYWYTTSPAITVSSVATGGSATTLVDTGIVMRLQMLGQIITITRGLTIINFEVNGVNIGTHTLNLIAVTGQTVMAADNWTIGIPGGSNYIDSGTVSSGTSTSMTDLTRTGSPFFSTGYYDLGYTLRIYHDNGDGTWSLLKFRITATNQAAGTLDVEAVDGQSISAGDKWEVHWPKYNLNRWVGAQIQIIKADGSIVMAEVKANDQNTIFLKTAVIATSPVGFKIVSFLPGDTLKWDGTYWIAPTGTDNRTDPANGKKPKFHINLAENLPFKFDWFGPIHIGTLSDPDRWNQLYDIYKLIHRRAYFGQGFIGGPDAKQCTWGLTEWGSLEGGIPLGTPFTGSGRPNPQCDIHLYSNYGVDTDNTDKYRLRGVSPQSVVTFDSIPYPALGAPEYIDSISAASILNNPPVLSDGYSLQGGWDGPESSSAYMYGQIPGNCVVTDGNGLTVELFAKATFGTALTSTSLINYQEIYNTHGANLGPKDSWFNFDSETTSNMDASGGAFPVDGAFKSTILGHIDTATVADPLTGTPNVFPPLPPPPNPPCPPPDGTHQVQGFSGSGYIVNDWFVTVDFASYITFG